MCASEIKKRNVHGTFRTPDGIKKTHSDYTIPEPEKQGKHGILQIPFHLDSSIKLMHIPERTKGKMAYIENRFFVGGTIEVEKVYSGRYGKRIPVSEKTKQTPEAVRKVNFRNKVKHLRRLIQNNFTREDYHLVLTYRKEDRPEVEKAKKMLRNFHTRMKRRYQKLGQEYKWICVTEYRTAAIHHHLVINSIKNVDMIRLLQECWQSGHINITPIYQDMDVEGLAEYLVKETKDTTQKRKRGEKHSPSLWCFKEPEAGPESDQNHPGKRMAERAEAVKGLLYRQSHIFSRGF